MLHSKRERELGTLQREVLLAVKMRGPCDWKAVWGEAKGYRAEGTEVSSGAVFTTLNRLAGMGLIAAVGGRKGRFVITEAGEEEYERWRLNVTRMLEAADGEEECPFTI